MRTVELCWCVCSLGTGDGESEHLKLMTHCASFQEMGSERLSTPTPKTPVLPTYIRPQSRERKRDEAFFKIEKLIWGSFNFGPLLFNNKAANRFMKPTRSWKMRIRIKKKKTVRSGHHSGSLKACSIQEKQKLYSVSVCSSQLFPTRHLHSRF